MSKREVIVDGVEAPSKTSLRAPFVEPSYLRNIGSAVGRPHWYMVEVPATISGTQSCSMMT